MRIGLLLLLLSSGLVNSASAQDDNVTLNPGVDRWDIKTTAVSGKRAKHIPLHTLLALPLLEKQFSKDEFDKTRIGKSPGNGLKEGDIITTEGYLHLVALEDDPEKNKDGDYHIQLTLNKEWSDSCFIVEIPHSKFISAEFKDSAINAREFIRRRLLKDKMPSKNGSVMDGTVFVKVTGQLFYDGIHAGTMRNADPKKNKYRGKSNKHIPAMHSYTAWELHPVLHIQFTRII